MQRRGGGSYLIGKGRGRGIMRSEGITFINHQLHNNYNLYMLILIKQTPLLILLSKEHIEV